MDMKVAHPQSRQGQGGSGISILVMGKIETIDFTKRINTQNYILLKHHDQPQINWLKISLISASIFL